MRRAALQRNQSEQERREDDVRRAMRMLQLMTPGLR